jgi:hypothetical protein
MAAAYYIIALIVWVATVVWLLTFLFGGDAEDVETYADPKKPVIAIVTMMRNPQELPYWFQYHRDMGVSHFFIRLEDGPNWERYVRERDDVLFFEAGKAATGNNYIVQMDRQGDFVNKAIAWCVDHRKERRIDMLVHIDQDELLYGSFDFIRAIPSDTKVFKLKNLEAQYDTSDPSMDATCFKAKSFVKTWESDSGARSYANGKSACVPSAGVRYNGPHRMSYKGSLEGPEVMDVPWETLCVRHYDSCTIGVFVAKFNHMRKDVDTSKIPFPAYIDAMKTAGLASESYDHIVSHTRKELVGNNSVLPGDAEMV